MKKNNYFNKKLIFLLFFGLVIFAGCSTTTFYSSNEMNYEVRILGPVSRTIGPFVSGKTVREKLITTARKMYGEEVDDVIDVAHQFQFWGFFWYYRLEGKAVDYVDYDIDF